ncbi:MAG: (2Fe-2S)-binding protein [Clostridium sp.]
MEDINRKVCKCKGVTYIEIKNAVLNGAHTVKEVKEKTDAGTWCGNCIPQIKEIIKETYEEK